VGWRRQSADFVDGLIAAGAIATHRRRRRSGRWQDQVFDPPISSGEEATVFVTARDNNDSRIR